MEENPETIKWLNNNAVEVLCVDYLEDIVVHNEAEGEISDSWTDMIKVVNNASVEDIQEAIDAIKERR